MNDTSAQAEPPLEEARLARLRTQMHCLGVPALLTADPINTEYASGARNMSIYSMMGAVRFLLVIADGPVVLWEFEGSEHLAENLSTIDEVRTAPGITALSGPQYVDHAAEFADEVLETALPWISDSMHLAVERMDHPVTDALRSAGLRLSDATAIFVQSRMIKLPPEIIVLREAMRRVLEGVEMMRRTLAPGRTEIEIWAELHHHLIAAGGQYISTRLAQAGHRTFPYFNEAGSTVIEPGDLFAIDTDAIGFGGYGVDFSRTYLCGDVGPSRTQLEVHAMALEQLQHNAANLAPGRSFESFARSAWEMPEQFAPFRYSCLAHGLGMSGEYPYIAPSVMDSPHPLRGSFEPGMVVCVESYIGNPETAEGVKLEDQYLITDSGAERMSTAPFDERLQR